LGTTEEVIVKDHTRLGQKLTAKQQAERAFQRDMKLALELGLIGLVTTEDGRTLIYMKGEDLPS
jgi:hypothetical protein